MNRQIFKKTFYLVLILLIVLPALSVVQAQGVFQWTKPKRIPNYLVTGRPPLLASDKSGNVHALNYESEGLSTGAIFYRRWNMEQGWSPPTDVILPTLGGGAQTVQGVFIDSDSIIHMIYYDGTQEAGDVYYTTAYAPAADRSLSWSKPVQIGMKAGPLNSATINGDGEGKLIVLYGGQQVGIGLYEVHSEDGGKNWSDPRWISLVNVKDQWPFSINSEIDAAGRLHIVWSVVNLEGVGVEVRYARQRSDMSGWEKEIVLARREGMDYSTNWPSIISTGENELLVIYQDSFPATRWMVQSMNGGDSWEPPIRPFIEIGEYERAILLKDSGGNIHMVLGNRTQNPEIHGMWYSRWMSNRWTALEAILSGPITPNFDPSAPQAIILQGNVLMATWWNNVRRENLTGAWYSHTNLDAPRLPYQVLPAPTSMATDEPTAIELPGRIVPTDLPTATPIAPGSFDTDAGPSTNPSIPILVGVLPALILLVAFVTFRIKNDKSR